MSKGVKLRIVSAAAVAVVLTLCDYLLTNWPYPLLDDLESLTRMEYLLHSTPDDINDSVLYLNVAYDKQLVDATDDFGDTIGKSVITDRAMLTRLLGIARKADYKFLVLDVRFEEGMQTAADSALWSVMAGLPRFAYSSHCGQPDGTPASLQEKGALADYGATISTGFSRWQFLQPDGESMPLRVYSCINGSTIKRHGAFYSDAGRLCYNTLFIPLSVDALTPEKSNGEVRYPLVGGDILRLNSDNEICTMMRDKIVVIGDFENDVHDTYVGSAPGSVLIYEAYKQLRDGHHLVKWGYLSFLFVLFFAIAYTVLSPFELIGRIPHLGEHPMLKTLLSFIGWEIILTIVSVVMYVTIKVSFNTFIPSLAFTAMAWLKSETIMPVMKGVESWLKHPLRKRKNI